MQTETKKAVVFGIIITFFTSAYTAFLTTLMKQGFVTGNFFVNWISLIPRTYLLLLPFVLITGRVTKRTVEWIFESLNKTK